MIKRRRMTLALLGAALVAALVLGTTLAALGSTTSQHENVFTPSPNITARLSEPNWDPDEGIRLVPGKEVRKDPMVTNTSQVEEYVAIRLTFCYDEGDMDAGRAGKPMEAADLEELLKWLEIDWNTGTGPGEWSPLRGSFDPAAQPASFYYNDALAPGQASEPLFNSVRIKNEFDTPGLTEAGLDFLKSLGRFSMAIEGAAVQTAGFDDAAAASDTLYALFP